jgi:hypothetical protein
MVSCGFGARAKLMPLPSKIEIVQSWLGRCLSMMVWKISTGGTEGDVVKHVAVAQHRHLDGYDQPFLHRADEQVGVLRAFGREHLLDDFAVVAQRQTGGVRRGRGEQLAAVAIRHQHHAIPAVLVEKARSHAAKIVEVAAPQRVGQ